MATFSRDEPLLQPFADIQGNYAEVRSSAEAAAGISICQRPQCISRADIDSDSQAGYGFDRS
jgi:hypothetical protein